MSSASRAVNRLRKQYRTTLAHMRETNFRRSVSPLLEALEARLLLSSDTQLIGLDLVRSTWPTLTGAGQTVVVIDTGINYNHPAFASTIWTNPGEVAGNGVDDDGNGFIDDVHGYDFVNNDGDPLDDNGHGTHVAGIIASAGSDAPGVAPGAKIIGLKALDADGNGSNGAIADALDWVIDNRAAFNITAVNLSLGQGNFTSVPSLFGLFPDWFTGGEESKLEALDDAGVFVCAAAGNSFYSFSSSQGLAYPAISPHAADIGAVWSADKGGPFQWGYWDDQMVWHDTARDNTTETDLVTSFSQRWSGMDILAPGGEIKSLGLGTDPGTPSTYYETMSGTSQATPFVTGASMLVRQALHDFLGVDAANKNQIIQILKDSADHVTDSAGDPDHDNVTNTNLTFDRLNIYSAIQSIIDQGDLTDDLADGQATVNGTIYPGSQRMLYTFTGQAGDLLTVTLDGGSLTDWLDTALAIFAPGQAPAYITSQDATGSFLRYSWETNRPLWPNSEDPGTIQLLLPQDGTYTIQVQVDPAATGGNAAGPYELNVTLNDLAPASQAFYLDFSEFEAADITGYFGYLSGDPAVLRQTILDSALSSFSSIFGTYDIQASSSAPTGQYSRLRFVDNTSPSYTDLLGIADQIDYGNLDHSDGAKIFFDHFGESGYQFDSAQDVGKALGTVAAHEAGHLLGLRHVDAIQPAEDLMGRLGGYSWLLTVPAFGNYDLYESPGELWWFDIDNGFDIFGKQDSAAILSATLGAAPSVWTGVRVLGTDPVGGGPQVAQNANIRVDFNEPMNWQTLNASTVQVVGSISGTHACTYNTSGSALTVDPSVDFSAGETVTVTVSRNVQATDGDHMAADYSTSFAAAQSIITSLSVVGVDPVSGGPMVARNSNIRIFFSELMDFTTLNSSNVTVVGSSSGAHDGGYNYSGTTLTIDPFADFSAGESVTVTVTQNVRAVDGDLLASPHVFSFGSIGSTPSPITVGGTLSSSTIWTTGNVYLVTSDLTIPAGVTLVIQPGVVVKFDAKDSPYYGDTYRNDIVVNGTLDLRSTASQRVVFTSSRDDAYGGDSNGDGTASSPSTSNWGAIKYTNPNNVLHDAVVRYGGLGCSLDRNGGFTDTQMVWVSGAAAGTLEIRNCVIEYAYDKAIYAESAQAPNVHDNTIRNASYGVYLAGNGTVEANTLNNNTWGIYLNGGAVNPTVRNNTLSFNTWPIYQGVTDPVYSGNVFNFTTGNNRVIAVGGTLGTDVVLESAGLPYLVYSDFTSPSGKTLTVDGGVIVKFASGKKLTVQGPFITNDNGSPVVFTSYRDDSYGGDTNGDGTSSGSPGDWAGIYFQTTNNIVDHALIRYAGINISGPAITLRQVTFDRTPDPAITLASGGAGTNIHSSNFLNASGYGIRNSTTNTIDARSNYWGNPSGPGGVGPGTGAGVTTYVTYSPWLTSPASINATGPVISSTPNTAAVVLNPYGYDVDGRASASGTGTLVWSRILGPADLSINSSTGDIAWMPVTPGDYVVGIAVTDDIGSTDQIWQIHVAMIGDTTPPTIVSYSHQIASQGGGLMQATLTSTFSESVQVRPIDVALLNATGQTVQLSSLSYDISNHRLTVVAQNLTASANYTFRLLDTITDDALNPLDGEFDGYTFPTGDGTPGGNFAATFTATPDTTSPEIIFWSSSAIHGSLGEVLLSIPDDGTFSEPRNSGICRLVVDFTEPIAPASFTSGSVQIAGHDVNGNDLDLSGIGISTSLRNGGTEGVIDFSAALPNVAGYVVRIQGVTDVAGNPLAGDDDRIIGALIGDATGDGVVDAADYIALKWAFGSSVALANASIDFDCSGMVDYGDLMALMGSFGQRTISAPALPARAASVAPSTTGGAPDIVAEPTVVVAEPEPNASLPAEPVVAVAEPEPSAAPVDEPAAAAVTMTGLPVGLPATSSTLQATAGILDALAHSVTPRLSTTPSTSRPSYVAPPTLLTVRVGPLPTFPSPLLSLGRAGKVVADVLQLAAPWWPGDSARHELPDEPWMTRLTVDIAGKLRKGRLGVALG